MTDTYFFDTDCLSSFLCINEENILYSLYGGNIVLPKQVFDEIIKVPVFKPRIFSGIIHKVLRYESIVANTQEAALYSQLLKKPMGKGEASAIAMVVYRGGILVSSNFADVGLPVMQFKLNHIGTADIIVDGFTKGLLTEIQGNNVWSSMLAKRRKLPFSTFSEYLHSHRK